MLQTIPIEDRHTAGEFPSDAHRLMVQSPMCPPCGGMTAASMVVVTHAGRATLGAVSTNVPDELAVFDDGVFELRDSARVVGHLATVIEKTWSPFRRHHQVWLLVTWADGRRERIFEDYQPWTVVNELRAGTLRWEGSDLSARRLHDDERARAWDAYGIKDDIGAYM